MLVDNRAIRTVDGRLQLFTGALASGHDDADGIGWRCDEIGLLEIAVELSPSRVVWPRVALTRRVGVRSGHRQGSKYEDDETPDSHGALPIESTEEQGCRRFTNHSKPLIWLGLCELPIMQSEPICVEMGHSQSISRISH